MRKISKKIEIGASVERVFDYVTRPENLLSIWPSLVEVTNVERKNDGWHSFDWAYKMGGIRFHGKAKTVRVEPNAYIEVKNEGGIPSVFRWRYDKRDKSTLVTLDVEYTVPTPVLGKVAEAIVAKMNEHETDTLLANLKATLEIAPTVKAGDAAHAHG
jgi:uncharacterized membrane protein